MRPATAAPVSTEFRVSQDTSSKELFDGLTMLTACKGPNADLPIRAYDEGRKGITLKIYNKKTSAGGLFKAAANPQRVSARILVIETIAKILKSESEKTSSPEEKKTIGQVLGNIKAKKSHCRMHDVKIPDLIADLSELKPIWGKSSANDKPALSSSSASTPPPKKTEYPKETKVKKSKATRTSEKTPSQSKTDVNPTLAKNKSTIQRSEKPNLIVKQEAFDLSSAITFLSNIKKYGEKFDTKANSKARIRVGEIKDTGELSFYVSTKTNRKAKRTDRLEEGRKAESKTTTSNRAITILRSIADSLVKQKRLTTDKVNEVFSAIEVKGYISVNDVSDLLKLLEDGRRAVYEQQPAVKNDSQDTSNTSTTLHFNTIPFSANSSQEREQMTTTQSLSAYSGNPFDAVQSQENKAANALPSNITVTKNPIEIPQSGKRTNPFDDALSHGDKTTEPTPPTFFQQVADFLKPVTDFLHQSNGFWDLTKAHTGFKSSHVNVG
jgi:hypothetical protein